MLRTLIAALLLVNLAFFAWTQGWLDSVFGVRANADREPERVQRQVDPDSIRVLAPGAAAARSQAAPALACFEAGPFASPAWDAAQAAAQAALPGVGFSVVTTDRPATWILYMGRYAGLDARSKKEQELERRAVAYDELGDPPALAPGLSLGRFDARAQAEQALERLSQQGIRTARVVELAPAATLRVLRIDAADSALAQRIAGLKDDAIAGKGFAPCKAPTSG